MYLTLSTSSCIRDFLGPIFVSLLSKHNFHQYQPHQIDSKHNQMTSLITNAINLISGSSTNSSSFSSSSKVLSVSIQTLVDPHSISQDHHPIITVGCTSGVELWRMGRNSTPKIFCRLPTPAPRLVHILSAPRGSEPLQFVSESNTSKYCRPLVAVVPRNPKHPHSNSVEIWSTTTKECVHVIHFMNDGDDEDLRPRRLFSNANVLAVSMGYVVHIFSIISFKHIRSFLSEPGAGWCSTFALGSRLLAVPSHGRKWSDLQHTRSSDEEETKEKLQKPDDALLGSISTAAWTKVDVAIEVEKGVDIGKRGASYVVSGVQSLIGQEEKEHSTVEEEEEEEEEDESDDGIRVRRTEESEEEEEEDLDQNQNENEDDDNNINNTNTTTNTNNTDETTIPSHGPSSKTIFSIGTRPSLVMEQKRKWPRGSIAIFDLKADSSSSSSSATRSRAPSPSPSPNTSTASTSSTSPSTASTSTTSATRGLNQYPVVSIAPPPSRGKSQCEVACVSFSPRGNQLSVAFEDGREVYVYAILHPILHETNDRTSIRRSCRRNTRVQLTHRLQRGLTRSTILTIQHSTSGRYISVNTQRGTTHVFATTPYTLVCPERGKRESVVAVVKEADVYSHALHNSKTVIQEDVTSNMPMDANGFRVFGSSHTPERASSPEGDAELQEETTMSYLSNLAYEYGSASLDHAYVAATTVANKMSEVVIGNDEESLTNNNNASNETSSKTTKTSTPAYISMLSVLKNPPKILTISPLLRIKLPPCSLTTTALDKEKEDKEQHYIGSLLSLLTTSFMWEDTQSRCVDIFAASYYTDNIVSVTAARGMCCARPDKVSSFTTDHNTAPSNSLVMEKLNEANWNLNIGTRTTTEIETWQTDRQRKKMNVRKMPNQNFKTSTSNNNGNNSRRVNKSKHQSKSMENDREWLNQMEMSTYTPNVAPVWARPDIQIYQLPKDEKEEKFQNSKKEKKKKKGNKEKKETDYKETTTPWWWKMPIQGKQNEQQNGQGVVPYPTDNNENVVKVVQIAIDSPMFQ